MQILQHWYLCLLAMSCGQSTKIMLSMPYRLREFNLDDGSIQDFSSNWTRIEYSIDFDKHVFMYRASPMSDAILKFRYPLDDLKEVLTHTIFANMSVDLAVDPVADHLYWVEYDYKGRIQRSDLNGTNVITVLSLEFLSTLDIDVNNSFVIVPHCI
ncbi:uncharacterized protein [Mytilus edulis]|uniref:uncharacterized protein n=1 Tax=Mytilus edulis TaxID=6550 RepID=UPI0039EEB0FB